MWSLQRPCRRILAKSLFTVFCSPLHESPSVFLSEVMILTSSAFWGCQPITYSGCLVTSWCCWPSAADEEWYSLKKHSGNPTQQGELSTEVSRLFLEGNNWFTAQKITFSIYMWTHMPNNLGYIFLHILCWCNMSVSHGRCVCYPAQETKYLI